MPIFFTYSHEDKEFVDQLARQLAERKAWVWIDRWELNVGDSIVERVQAALQEANAVIIILSPSSVTSSWVQRELASVIYREVQDKKSLIVPVLIKECQIPAFLSDRLYADFRTDFDAGLRTLLEALGKVTNATQGRVEAPNFHTDWAMDWGQEPAPAQVQVTLIDHSKDIPFAILTQIKVTGNEPATDRFRIYATEGLAWIGRGPILDSLVSWARADGPTITLNDSRPLIRKGGFGDEGIGIAYAIELTSRWVGTDTGKDILLTIAENLERVVGQWKKTIRPPTQAELMRGLALLSRTK